MRETKWTAGAMLPVAAWLAATVVLLVMVTACSATSPNAGAAYGTGSAAMAAGTGASGSSPSAMGSGHAGSHGGTTITIQKTKIGYALADAAGHTVYWYGDDVPGSSRSACTGACLTAWPAVTGKPVLPAGVKLAGTLGSFTRSDGSVQATYNGYPLYTYALDTAAGQVLGNEFGGVWHVITGKTLAASATAAAADAAASAASKGT